jgi:hypothetical protein
MGKSFCLSDIDRWKPAGQTRFGGPRFIHSVLPRGFQPPQSPHQEQHRIRSQRFCGAYEVHSVGKRDPEELLGNIA